MNERIQELIGQAQKEVWGNSPYNGSPEFEGYELDAEKFAELIVQECADFIDSHEQVDKYGEAMNIVYGEDLIKHFGVEE